MAASYSYNPGNLSGETADRMRFELGDVAVANGEKSAYLSDEEIQAMIGGRGSWDSAKLALVSHLLHRFGYEVNTKVGALSLELKGRVDFWRRLYDELRAQGNVPPSAMSGANGRPRPPIFRVGQFDNHAYWRGRHNVLAPE